MPQGAPPSAVRQARALNRTHSLFYNASASCWSRATCIAVVANWTW